MTRPYRRRPQFSLTRAILILIAAATLLPALGMTIGMTAREVGDRAVEVAADELRADRDYHAATPDTCQAAALADTRANLPGLGIEWRWADLDHRGAVGTALLRSRIVFLDPDLDCRHVPAVAYHEWTHIAQTDLYGGPRMLDSTIVSDLADETGRPHEVEVHEVVADCAAMLLADEHGNEQGPRPYMRMLGGCPPDMLARAREVIGHAGVTVADGKVSPLSEVGSAVWWVTR